MRFNVYTEMTPGGRERPIPTGKQPLSYFSPAGNYVEMGWQIIAGEKPPPWQELQAVMQKELAANHYVPVATEGQRPDLLIVFTFGSFSTDRALLAVGSDGSPISPPPVNAAELVTWLFSSPLPDSRAIKDVTDRARFIGGPRVAEDLREAMVAEQHYHGPPDFSPVQLLLKWAPGNTTQHVLEPAFHTCYFVTATAYDFTGVETKQKMLLWQTRMTVEAQGVEMREVLKPLIVNTGSFLGRETPETVIVDKRISREGRVEIGEAKVVPDSGTTPAPEPKK